MWLLLERNRSLELQERGVCAEQAYVSSGRGRPVAVKQGRVSPVWVRQAMGMNLS